MIGHVAIAVLLAVRASAPAQGQKGIEPGDLDRSVEPCTDFYEFANGAWRKANPIPESKPRWSRRIAARDVNRTRVRELLEEISRRKDWPKGSAEQVIGDHYASCMDEAGVEAAGLTPLARPLAEIDGIRDAAGVQHAIRRLHELAVNVPFAIASNPDYHEPTKTIANLVAGDAGIPDRARVLHLLTLGGMSGEEAGKAADAVVALEKRLAEASLDSATANDPAATDHKTTFAELERLAPHIDWSRYFDAAKLPRVDLNVSEPKLLRQVDTELAETPISTWKAYLKVHLLESASPSLPRAFAKASETRPRAERCVESTEALFGEAVGRKYVERHFPPAAKAKVREIAGNLLAALSGEVAGVEWMGQETRKKALEKLAATDLQVGYPDAWKDLSAVVVRRDSFFANVVAGRKLAVDEDRGLIGKPTNRDLWALPPSSPDAYIDLQLNKVGLPAGFLQPPYFDPDATDAVNYGSLGIGLAHDLTHAIDASGSETDITGHPRNWWTDADRKEFEKLGQCVVDQFEGYFVEPGVHHQGKRVLSESIGDLAGVRVAYRALEASMRSRPVPTLDGFTPEQQFFIAWGQTTGAAMRIEAQRELVAGDPHPVPKFRVIGPLSNSLEFQRAFSCRAGSAMVRPPEKRCTVW